MVKAKTREVTEEQFEAFSHWLSDTMGAIRKNAYKKMRAKLMSKKDLLARCSLEQINLLHARHSCPLDLLKKVREAGRGKMPAHVVRNRALSFETYNKLPPKDRARWDNPKSQFVIGAKNRKRIITPEEAEEDGPATRKMISAFQPQRGIMEDPEDQSAPRPYPKGKPQYFELKKYEKDGGWVLLRLERNGSKVTARVRLTTLQAIMTELAPKRRRKK